MRKKALTALLTAAVMLVSMIPVGAAVLPVSAASIGDVGADGEIDIFDAMDLYMYASGETLLTDAQIAVGDVNDDGAVDIFDAMELYRIASGEGGEIVNPDVDMIDLLVYDNIDADLTENATVTVREDGGWLIEASAAGQVAITGPGLYDAEALQYVHIAIASDVPFKVSFYDAANDKWMTSEGDFFTDYAGTAWNEPTPAGTYTNLSLYTKGCYIWDGSALPETVQFSAIYIKPQAEGTLAVGHMALHKDATCTCDIADLTLPSTTPVTVSIGSATASVGDTVTVPVSVSDNHYIVNGRIFVNYDPMVLELQAVRDHATNPYVSSIDTTVLGSGMWDFRSPTAGEAKFVFISNNNVGLSNGGDIYTLTFKVIKAAPSGTELTLTVPEMRSNDDPTATNTTDFGYATNTVIVNGVITTV